MYFASRATPSRKLSPERADHYDERELPCNIGRTDSLMPRIYTTSDPAILFSPPETLESSRVFAAFVFSYDRSILEEKECPKG
jgi:hypothetical protein